MKQNLKLNALTEKGKKKIIMGLGYLMKINDKFSDERCNLPRLKI